jgi:DNA-binding LacI/PurR family transcriptional regulator
MPHHGIFINVESAIYEALKVLYLNGYRRVALFTPGPAENIIDTSKKARGYIRFMEEFKIAERAEDFSVKVYNSYELSRKKQLVVKWAKELHPETDAIIGFSDYNIIKAQEWLQDYSKIDFRKICFIGRGNTNWSSSGPNRFASFDFRIEDIITETLELINSSPTEPVIRILKPKLKRKELIKSRN